MLFEFHKANNPTVATKNICDIRPSAVCKCQRWFSKFRSRNFNHFDSYRSGRPTTTNSDVLRTEVETNPCQITEEQSNTLNKPW